MKINRDLIKERMWSKYTPFLKADNKRTTTSIVHMAMVDLSVSRRTIFNILAGEKISLSLLKKVIEIYDIEPQDLFIKEED